MSGLELVWLDRVQHTVLNTAELARVSPQQKSAWLAQLGQRSRVLNRLCLSTRLQLLALSSVQLSCSLTLLLLLCPGQLLLGFVATADTICLCVVTAWQVRLSVVALADCCSSVDQVMLPFGIAPPNCSCLAGDPLWHDNHLLVDQSDLSADGLGAACATTH